MFETAILFIIFKRKETALKVLEIIKQIKPKYLYIAADGWRDENEKIKCLETREAVLKAINFECEIKTLFRDKNLGCCDGVAGAIQWFFENVEQGIILEDDCLPEISFFDYCEKLLNYYKDNERIMHITGDSPLDRKVGEASYYFATIQHCWGWASWRRAWDYQWTYSIISKDGICINPNLNMVSNIGFGADSTHTSNPEDENANRKTYPMDTENIIHPSKIECDREADFEIAIKRFGLIPFSLTHNVSREIKRIIRQIGDLFKSKD